MMIFAMRDIFASLFTVYNCSHNAHPPSLSLRIALPLMIVVMLELLTATIDIFIRSSFRVAEPTGGFHGKLWNDEVVFMCLDGAMVGLACLFLTVYHFGLILS